MTAVLRPRRLALLVAALAALVLAPFGPMTPVALADSGMESSFVAKVNAERSAQGLPSLSTNGGLTSTARSWSGTMASQTNLYHNPNLGSQVSGWQAVGENVGRGPSVDAIHSALMASPGHKANILDPRWTEIGVGVVVKDGTVWVTQVFRQPSGGGGGGSSSSGGSSGGSSDGGGSSSGGSSSGGSSSGGSSSGGSSSSGSSGSSSGGSSSGGNSSGGSSSGGSSSSSSSGSGGSGGSSEPAPDPEPEPEPEPDPEPEPHEVIERPLPLDRATLTLARLAAIDLEADLSTVLASDD